MDSENKTTTNYSNEDELTDYVLEGKKRVESNMKAINFLFLFIILVIIIKLLFSIYEDIYGPNKKSEEIEEEEEDEDEDDSDESDEESDEDDKDYQSDESKGKKKEKDNKDKKDKKGKKLSNKEEDSIFDSFLKKIVNVIYGDNDEKSDKDSSSDESDSKNKSSKSYASKDSNNNGSKEDGAKEKYSTYTSLANKKNDGYISFENTYSGSDSDSNSELVSNEDKLSISLPKVIYEKEKGFFDDSYYQKLRDVQSYYKFNNKPKYSLNTEATKGFRPDYTYDLCSVNKQPIDALDFNGKFTDERKFIIEPDQ